MRLPRWKLAACLLIFGCAPASIAPIEESPPDPIGTDFQNLPTLLKTIGAGELGLYEGLPSEFWEPQVREQELKSKKIVTFLGHPFYEEQPPLTDEDARLLTELLSTKTSFHAYRSQKPCGGFHADYCLEWKTPETTTLAIVSLECQEIVLSGPDGDLKCDLSPESAEKLDTLLNSYQQNRPPAQTGP